MGRRNNKNITDIHRDIRKTRPNLVNNYRGGDLDSFEQRMGTPFPCRFCGQPLEPFRDWGPEALWNCNTLGCSNNLNNKFKFDVNRIDDIVINNPARKWNDWMPKRLI